VSEDDTLRQSLALTPDAACAGVAPHRTQPHVYVDGATGLSAAAGPSLRRDTWRGLHRTAAVCASHEWEDFYAYEAAFPHGAAARLSTRRAGRRT